MSAADKASDKAASAKSTLVDRLREDGVVNPAGFGVLAVAPLFFAMVPVTTWLARPQGFVGAAVTGLARAVAYVGSAGATSTVSTTGKLAAISTLYIGLAFAVAGAGSAAGTGTGNTEGRDNKHPRAQNAKLTGLPLRLLSAQQQLTEAFGGYALAAGLTAALAPTDEHLVNLLGLHVISKVLIFYPSYLLNLDLPRTLAHVIATASVIGAGVHLTLK